MSKHCDLLKYAIIGLCFFLAHEASCQRRGAAALKQSDSTEMREEERESEILNKILYKNPKYNKNIRAVGGPTNDGETEVTVDLGINRLSKIDDFNMEFAIQITLREQWMDERLRYEHLDPTGIEYLTLGNKDDIWMPDLFFINEKSGHLHSIIKPNVLLRIYRDGTIKMAIRISLTLGCNMELGLFPLDTQNCSIIMSSYAWTTKDVEFRWRAKTNTSSPVQRQDLHLPQFDMETHEIGYCDDVTPTGIYSCIRVDLKLVRNFSFYLTSAYIPCLMLVIVSWVSFYIDENAVPARVALGVTTLLTMATHQANINKNLPPVSYIKAIDVWTETCLTFIFAALVEFALVNYAIRFDKRNKAKAQNDYAHDPGHASWLSKRYTSTSKKIDIVARVLFPMAFLIFNLIYWSYYLIKAHEVQSEW